MRLLARLFRRDAKPRQPVSHRRRLALEPLEDRSLLSVVVSPTTDPGNTTATAHVLPAISSDSRYIVNQSENSLDKSDYYKLTIPANEPVNLSLTGFTQNLNLELRNSSGALLVGGFSSGTAAESISRSLSSGTYYVAVTYDGTVAGTNYTLTISAGNNWRMISGINNEVHHVGVISAGGGANIVSSAESWLLIHDRNSSPSYFGDGSSMLASAVASAASGSGATIDRVLEVDWETVTAKKSASDYSNPWIIKTGDAVAGILTGYSITRTYLNEIGHGWGALLAYEIGRSIGGGNGVNRLVALDPAPRATGYDETRVNFAAVSAWSWVFISSTISGGANKASSADESFTVRSIAGNGQIGASDVDAHSNAVPIFVNLISRTDSLASPFKLSQVKSRSLPWKVNRYNQSGAFSSSGIFEAVICCTQQNSVWKPSNVLYVKA